MAPVVSVVRVLPRSKVACHRHLGGTTSPVFQRTTSFLSSDKVEYRANHTSERERAKTVAAFYNQPAIEEAAKKVGKFQLHRYIVLETCG